MQGQVHPTVFPVAAVAAVCLNRRVGVTGDHGSSGFYVHKRFAGRDGDVAVGTAGWLQRNGRKSHQPVFALKRASTCNADNEDG